MNESDGTGQATYYMLVVLVSMFILAQIKFEMLHWKVEKLPKVCLSKTLGKKSKAMSRYQLFSCLVQEEEVHD